MLDRFEKKNTMLFFVSVSTDEFCSYEEFTNSTFLHSDVQYLALNKSEVRKEHIK